MNVFDIIGPVMIGPSSSHTAGAVRIGRVANKLMDDRTPRTVEITLSGSFAQTYRGHGTDKALLAGIMGYHSYAEEIRDALEIAKARGIDYTFVKKDIPGAHPNTAVIRFVLEDGTEGSVQGASVGGGNIRVDLVNGMKVDFNGDYHTMLVMHLDRPGVIASVTSLMRYEYADLNISNFHLSREARGGNAIMTIEIDTLPPDSLIEDIRKLEYVTNALLIRKL
ncbi:MAG: L-serine ammonia-lyase, iron-sulfur-dependent subunit beta [Lachnospiraceae bacterium]|nr:L-serine ammonia-lyase, iron-sulfur-dependent subunit beta [Lachnospiraceae bacterium]